MGARHVERVFRRAKRLTLTRHDAFNAHTNTWVDSVLSPALMLQLSSVEPSANFGRKFYPCAVRLKDGGALNRVCLADAETFWFFTRRHAPPSEVPGIRWISAAAIESIQESPYRLPARFANVLYGRGETGMGYFIFTVVFSFWLKRTYLAEGFVDFIDYPPGRGPSDVREVIPHTSKRAFKAVPAFHWCVFDE